MLGLSFILSGSEAAVGVAAGLALFLFGMTQMTGALKSVAGPGMKGLLARLTGRRASGVLTGAVVTSIIQSSSVTTVLLVGFVSAGLMNLGQAIPVIMGANIGTTVTAQIVAFKVTKAALALIALGFFASVLFRRESIRQYGVMAMGLGLLFFGMNMMSEASAPLRDSPWFVDAMASLTNRWMSILVAAAFTALVQSSSATTGVIIVLAGQGFISLETGIALAFGANIGTCVTAMLAAIGKPVAAVRTAIAHVLFNVLGVLVWVWLIDELAWVVRWMSPHDTPREIANAHTVFNVINTLLFIGLTGPMAWLATRLAPSRRGRRPEGLTKYLDDALLDTPELAMDRAHRENLRLGRHALSMVRWAPNVVLEGGETELLALRRQDQRADALYQAIADYLGRLTTGDLTGSQSTQLRDELRTAFYFEAVADVVEDQLVSLGLKRASMGVALRPEFSQRLRELIRIVGDGLETVIDALEQGDAAAAERVIELKPKIVRLAHEANDAAIRDLGVKGAEGFTLLRLETDLTAEVQRMYYFVRRVAKIAARKGGEG